MNQNDYICTSLPGEEIDDRLLSELDEFVCNQSKIHSDHPAMLNMGHREPQGFLYNLRNQIRWSNDDGEVAILRKNGKIIGVSCVENGEISNDISIGGIRCWLDSSNRSDSLMSRYLLSSNLSWSVSRNKVGMMLSFNDYNKWIYDGVKRITSGKAAGLSKVWSDWWKDCVVLPQQINIRYTKQWCVIKPVDIEKLQKLEWVIKNNHG